MNNRIDNIKELVELGLDANRIQIHTDEQILNACLAAENGAIDWEKGDKYKDSAEKQARLYAESALEW